MVFEKHRPPDQEHPFVSTTPVSALLSADTPAFTYGADYNPEQWAPDVWVEDARLMREAGVNLVAINIFGWAQLEPARDQFDFSGLDAVIDVLHENGIAVNLGTGTSSPPPWLSAEHPESLPMMSDGTRRYFGGRQAFCPNSPVYRERALVLVEQVARRYGSHPAVKLWHVANEIGCHNAHCYCDDSAEGFRDWLRAKYRTIDALNAAWGTAFWSQRYSAWEHVGTPKLTVATGNPSQALDFMRFSSDSLLELYTAEEQLLREHSEVPVTTNFMVTAHIRNQDYWAWAPHMDLIANDHYLDNRLEAPAAELTFAADLTRGLAGGDPWLLMETATSSVNWQPRNTAKVPRELIRNALTHVARGADGISFFQWRASLQGSEKFHSAMLPHTGTETKIWREAVELGGILSKLSEVTGSRVVADVAMVFDWQAWWATDLDSHPSAGVEYLVEVHRAHRALVAAGHTVDLVAPGAPLDGYSLVVVPCLYTVSDESAAVISDYVAAGGHAVVTFFSGIVDSEDRVRTGGYPGAFRDLLGVHTEEFFPVDASLTLSDGSTSTLWSEWVHADAAEVVATFSDGPTAGVPAITRNAFGAGAAWYLATAIDDAPLAALFTRIAGEAGVVAPATVVSGVEVVRRRGDDHTYLFVINHTDAAYETPARGTELIGATAIDGSLVVPAREVAIVRLDSDVDSSNGRDIL
jgi:beta-galactosidase